MNTYKLVSNIMNKILNFHSIVGLLGFCLSLRWDNRKNEIHLDAKTIAILLVGTVFIYARKGILSSILKITISILGLGYSLAKMDLFTMQEFMQVAVSLFALLLSLFVFNVMFGELNKNNDEIHFSINPKTGKIKRRWL